MIFTNSLAEFNFSWILGNGWWIAGINPFEIKCLGNSGIIWLYSLSFSLLVAFLNLFLVIQSTMLLIIQPLVASQLLFCYRIPLPILYTFLRLHHHLISVFPLSYYYLFYLLLKLMLEWCWLNFKIINHFCQLIIPY